VLVERPEVVAFGLVVALRSTQGGPRKERDITLH
jgi:hypothetical protein